AQDPIFDPSMTITEFGIVSSPIGEEVDKVIDGTSSTKFLDFELGDGIGFTVDLGGASRTAISMDITTANDFPVRDPIDFEVFGSNNGSSFTSVATGTIDCISDRFFTRSYTFTNTTAYSFYRLNFSAPCDPSGGTGIPSIQIAEVQLFEEVLAINDNPLSENIVKVYPNPSSGILTVNYSGNDKIQSVKIISVSGKIVQEISNRAFNSEQTLDISSLGTGIYFLRISSAASTITKKIIRH
ncbi:MAG: T9SS type A sorting domain-containing protein, partial [Flavobacteriaceae bacterium]|nr:T9SS type A sorting domain-containing protein [Flavobacteriaceae bacterium]